MQQRRRSGGPFGVRFYTAAGVLCAATGATVAWGPRWAHGLGLLVLVPVGLGIGFAAWSIVVDAIARKVGRSGSNGLGALAFLSYALIVLPLIALALGFRW